MTTIQQKFMALQGPFPPVRFRNGGSGYTTHCTNHPDTNASLDIDMKTTRSCSSVDRMTARPKTF